MKNLKRFLSLALCLMLALACVPAMADGHVKIGVLVSDATSSEALAFRAYYTEYIAKAYGVEFIYSDELTDAAGEKSAIDNFIVNNCKAVISFSSFDRPAQIDQCEAAGIYYAVATGTLTPEQLCECEQLANEAIAADVPITVSYPDSEALAALTYRSKLEMTENVRIVTIDGIDVCACCAPHLPSTGRIGMIKIVSQEQNRGGTRVHIVCGLEALELFRRRLGQNAEIMHLLSSKPEETASHVSRLLEENRSLKAKLAEIGRRELEKILDGLDRLENSERRSFCVFVPEDFTEDTMRKVANKAVTLTDGAAAVLRPTAGGYSCIIASKALPLRQLARELFPALGGRGGGSDEMIQGSVTAAREEIVGYVERL